MNGEDDHRGQVRREVGDLGVARRAGHRVAEERDVGHDEQRAGPRSEEAVVGAQREGDGQRDRGRGRLAGGAPASTTRRMQDDHERGGHGAARARRAGAAAPAWRAEAPSRPRRRGARRRTPTGARSRSMPPRRQYETAEATAPKTDCPLFVPSARCGDGSTLISAGTVSSPPPPAMASTSPAAKATAARTRTAAHERCMLQSYGRRRLRSGRWGGRPQAWS